VIFDFIEKWSKKANGKILPLTDYLSREDQTQELHIFRAIGRALPWWWRM